MTRSMCMLGDCRWLLKISGMTICWTSVALMFRYAFMQWSRGLSAISRWAVFARDLIYDIAGLRCWLTRLSAGKKITKILVGCACWRNWVPLQDAANLLIGVRIVRYKDFDRMLIGLGGCGCRKINRLLSSVHDMGNVWEWITVIEKNSADVV